MKRLCNKLVFPILLIAGTALNASVIKDGEVYKNVEYKVQKNKSYLQSDLKKNEKLKSGKDDCKKDDCSKNDKIIYHYIDYGDENSCGD